MTNGVERLYKTKSLYAGRLVASYETEAKILADTIEVLTLIGAPFTREEHATKRGVADIIACVNGRYVAIELKDKDGTPSAQQIKFNAKIKAGGGIAVFCKTLETLFDTLEEAMVK